MFLVGAHQVIVEPTNIVANAELAYEESGTHQATFSILIEGTIKPSGSAEFLLNGERNIERLPIGLRVVADAPLVWENASERQTQVEPDGLGTDTVSESLGQFHFIKAFQINKGDSIWVDVNLSESLFADLWAWIRSGCRLRQVCFDVYGESMHQISGFSSTTYHWKQDNRSFLHVANFSYSLGQTAERAAGA